MKNLIRLKKFLDNHEDMNCTMYSSKNEFYIELKHKIMLEDYIHFNVHGESDIFFDHFDDNLGALLEVAEKHVNLNKKA